MTHHMTKRARNRVLAHLGEDDVQATPPVPAFDDTGRPAEFAWGVVLGAAVLVCVLLIVIGVAAISGGWLR